MERGSAWWMGLLRDHGQNMAWMESGTVAAARASRLGLFKVTVMPSSRYPSASASGMVGKSTSSGCAGWNGMWCGIQRGGGTWCWLGLWSLRGSQRGSSMVLFARLKTPSEAWLNLDGAGEEPKGRRSMAMARPATIVMQAAAMLHAVCLRRYAFSITTV
eukprot:13620184-Ditylum_brightwellii.AAC.1